MNVSIATERWVWVATRRKRKISKRFQVNVVFLCSSSSSSSSSLHHTRDHQKVEKREKDKNQLFVIERKKEKPEMDPSGSSHNCFVFSCYCWQKLCSLHGFNNTYCQIFVNHLCCSLLVIFSFTNWFWFGSAGKFISLACLCEKV